MSAFKEFRLFCLLTIVPVMLAHTSDDWEDNIFDREETLFVSLGSYCAPALMTRYNGIRLAAFPFDWVFSLDGEKLIEVLEDDFKFLLNEDYLAPWIHDFTLLNTHYHMEFIHEGSWREDAYFARLLTSKINKRMLFCYEIQ